MAPAGQLDKPTRISAPNKFVGGINCAGNPPGTAANTLIRIRILQTPTLEFLDGIDLRRFRPGLQFEVGNTLGALLLAEGWAEPVSADESAVLPASQRATDSLVPTPNLIREFYPPYYDAPSALSADRRRRRRRGPR